MALRRVSDIRPLLVLECSLSKNILETKEREREKRSRVEEKSRFWWEIIPIFGFQVIKEEEGS